MPFTPFHFGPGIALYAAAPSQISLLAFCAANILIDVEPLYFMLTGQFPLHRFFHTYLGASLVPLLILMLFAGVRKLSSVIDFPPKLGFKHLTIREICVGAALGSYSHIVLDSLMHSDIRPFAPLSEANPFLGIIALDVLHWSCLVLGVAGCIVAIIRWNTKR